MQGTVKQVKWAESIRTEALKEINADIHDMSVIIMTEGGDGALFLAKIVECLEEAREIDSAAWWIEAYKRIQSSRYGCWANEACRSTRAGHERSARTRERWLAEWNEKLDAANNDAERRHYRSLIIRDEAELAKLRTTDPIPVYSIGKKSAKSSKKDPWIHLTNTPEHIGRRYTGQRI